MMMIKEEESMQLIAPQQMMLCEACEAAPAAFLCKADSASLCAACDEAVHSANPLANRHHRVPIVTSTATRDVGLAVPKGKLVEEEDEEEAVSWLFLNPTVKGIDGGGGGHKGLFVGEMVDYLGLEDYDHTSLQGNDGFGSWWPQPGWNNYHHHVVPEKSFGGEDVEDSVVPIQVLPSNMAPCPPYSAPSSQNGPLRWNQKQEAFVELVAAGDECLFLSPSAAAASAAQMAPAQLSPMEREARVLRYREKKKTRRFEKTIRYASRKAYAETRPRIKGRFAKRSRDNARVDNEADDDDDDEADEILSGSFLASYGIVPSFSLCS